MADASKLKNLKFLKNTLGHAPQEPSSNVEAPETINHLENNDYRIDARSLRRTSRTARLATSVTPEFDNTLRKIALEKRMLLSEVLEEALKLYEKHLKK
jgi:hypothetical protein